MCAGPFKPDTPAPPPPPPPPEKKEIKPPPSPAKDPIEREKRAYDRQKKKSATSGGTATTQLTGPSGLMGQAVTGSTLLSSTQGGMS